MKEMQPPGPIQKEACTCGHPISGRSRLALVAAMWDHVRAVHTETKTTAA